MTCWRLRGWEAVRRLVLCCPGSESNTCEWNVEMSNMIILLFCPDREAKTQPGWDICTLLEQGHNMAGLPPAYHFLGLGRTLGSREEVGEE